jgi:restriction endonuclease Mrr
MRGPRCCSGGSTSPPAAHRPTLHDEEPPIDLIDGDGLCELLKRYELGVKTTVRQVEEVAIHPEFFQDV